MRSGGWGRVAHQSDPEDGMTAVSALDRDRADLRSPATAVARDDVDLVVGHRDAPELSFELVGYAGDVLGGDDGQEGTTAEIPEQLDARVVQPGDHTVAVDDRARDVDVLKRLRQVG